MSAPGLILAADEHQALPAWVATASIGSVVVAAFAGVAASSVTVAVVVVLAAAAVVVGWADVSLRRVPNVMCLMLVSFAVAATLVDESATLASVAAGALATAFPFGVLHAIEPRWVGFGDVKLLAASGATLGLLSPFAGLTVAWAAGVAILVSWPVAPPSWRRSIPFGFWLSTAAVPVSVWFGATP